MNGRILILCGNLSVGGIAKSLIAMLKAVNKKGVKLDVAIFKCSDKELLGELQSVANVVEVEELKKIPITSRRFKKIIDLFKRRVFINTLFLHLYSRRKNKCGKDGREKFMKHYLCREYKICKNSKVKVDLDSYDCVISWSEAECNYMLAENIVCKNKIGWVHPDYIDACFYRKVDEIAFKNLNAVVAVSENGCNSLKKTFPEMEDKFFCIPNLIDIEHIRQKALEPQTEILNNAFNIVTVARLQNISKAFDRAVRISAKLKAEGLNFTWHIVGDGDDRASIQQDIINYGVEDVVKLIGKKENPYPYMKNADLFVLQSYYEGQPICVDEAMVIGTPVLVTDYKSAKEQVLERNGGFVINNNEKDIYDKIYSLITSPEELLIVRERLKNEEFLELTDTKPFENLLERVCR